MQLSVLRAYGLSFLALLGTSQAPDDKPRQTAEGLAKIHLNWGPALNSPGVSVRLKETSRQRADNFTIVRYRIYGEGVRPADTYSLVEVVLPEAEPQTRLAGISFSENGLAMCAGRPKTCGTPDKPNDPIELAVRAAKGEVKHFSLISEDGGSKMFFSVAPFPIQVADQTCTLELQRVLPNAEIIVVQGTSFAPNAEITLNSSSEGEKHSGAAKTDAHGSYGAVLLPYVKGKLSGKVRVTLHSTSCNPSASIDWGRDSYRYQ